MVLALARAFGIFGIAGIAVFCLLDAVGNIRRGYTAALPTIWRPQNGTSRSESPAGFWMYVGLKLACAAAAALFVIVYCVVALATR